MNNDVKNLTLLYESSVINLNEDDGQWFTPKYILGFYSHESITTIEDILVNGERYDDSDDPNSGDYSLNDLFFTKFLSLVPTGSTVESTPESEIEAPLFGVDDDIEDFVFWLRVMKHLEPVLVGNDWNGWIYLNGEGPEVDGWEDDGALAYIKNSNKLKLRLRAAEALGI